MDDRNAARRVKPAGEAPSELPAPVARYLSKAFCGSAPRIAKAHLTQEGKLRTGPRSGSWMRFEAEQHVDVAGVGFECNARVTWARLLRFSMKDSLCHGREERPELNSGALHRYLAEAVWYPSALLPSRRLQWTPIDGRKALATLTAEGVSVSLEFWFSEADEVMGVYTPARWGRFGGRYLQMPWEGHFRRYGEWSGMRLPGEAAAGWYCRDVWEPVWMGRMTGFRCEAQ